MATGAQPALVNYGHPDATVGKLLDGLDIAVILSDRDISGITITQFDDATVREMATAIPVEDLTVSGSPDDVGAYCF